jgi:membrane-bound lytic murein transglycosylase D
MHAHRTLLPPTVSSPNFPKATNPIRTKQYPRLFSSLALMLFITACSTLPDSDLPTADNASVGPAAQKSQSQSARRSRALSGTNQNDDTSAIVYTDIWTRLDAGMQFSEGIDDERVNIEIAKYLQNPDYFRIVSERARPYLYEIVQLIEERDMPTELALLPFIESAYNPNAAAPPDTVGLWQIMGSTGLSLGLTQDWWYDGRRDPIASTEAALDYLKELYLQFDESWPLALAAYNTGPGNLQKAINRAKHESQSADYWSLSLPQITQEYVPKLIALSRIISEREAFEIALVDVPNEPVIYAMDVGSQIDLTLAAELSGVEPELLFQLNAGYLQWATHPDQPHHLYLPVELVDKFTVALGTLDDKDRVTWDRYTVRSGDSLGTIAQRFNTQVSALQRANNISGSRIIAGESLLIPRAYRSGSPLQAPNAPIYATRESVGSPAENRPTRYTVRSGDSLWSIARRFDLSSSDLAQWNDIDLASVLRLGQELHLLSDPTLALVESTERENSQLYAVRKGDTLMRIAGRLSVNLEDLMGWNDISENELIHPGQQLRVVLNAN